MSSWRVTRPCADCPFSDSPGGTRQREALRPGRMASIKRELLGARGREPSTFYCHKTTEETGNGSKLLCAGALAFQEKHGVSSNYQRVCETLDWMAQRRAEKKGAQQ